MGVRHLWVGLRGADSTVTVPVCKAARGAAASNAHFEPAARYRYAGRP